MGVCASCLGFNGNASRDQDEADPLLDDSNAFGYGSAVSQPDEEELRRERDAMDRITNEATENMIDVLHPNPIESRFAFAAQQTGTQRSAQSTASAREEQDTTTATAANDAEDETEEESSWWQAIQSAEADKVTRIEGLDADNLVMDLGQLKDESAARPAGRRQTKARLTS